MVLAAMDSAKTLDTNGIIDTLTNTSIDAVIGKLAVRKKDHQGMVGTYLAEAVKLPQPRYGAAVSWKVPKVLPRNSIKVDLAQTGCKGL
jgi:hypothetical protein